MSTDSDLMKLYSTRILGLAASIPHTERLAEPGGTGRARSPLCGSSVTVDVTLERGRVAAFGQDVKACALGQASAAVLGAVVVGLTRDEVAAGRAALRAMLSGDGPVPDAPFGALEVLTAARDFSNRHASILLPFDATLAAMNESHAIAKEKTAALR